MRLRQIIKTMIKVNDILKGQRVAEKLIKKYPDIQMLFTYEAIGDWCMELAFAKAYKEEHAINRIGIVTTSPESDVYHYFCDCFDLIIPLSKEEHSALFNFYKSDLGLLYRRKHKGILCVYPTAFCRSDLLLENPYIIMTEIIKNIYRIPAYTIPSRIKKIPCEEWIKDLEERGIIQKARTVLINPYANSVKGIPISFFRNIGNALIQKGYRVIASAHDENNPIGGEIPTIRFGMDKAVALADYCGYVIGVRSGFMDLMVFSDANIISIDHASYQLADGYNLEKNWPWNHKIKSIRYCEEIQPDVVICAFEELNKRSE